MNGPLVKHPNLIKILNFWDPTHPSCNQTLLIKKAKFCYNIIIWPNKKSLDYKIFEWSPVYLGPLTLRMSHWKVHFTQRNWELSKWWLQMHLGYNYWENAFSLNALTSLRKIFDFMLENFFPVCHLIKAHSGNWPQFAM